MSEESNHYNPLVLDHFNHPRNMGEMESPDGVGEAMNPVCGDTLRLFIKVEDDHIVASMFLAQGCGAAIAASSMTTEMIKGKAIEEALAMTNKTVAEALGGLPPAKVHCSVLAEKAVRAAVLDYRKRNTGTSCSSTEKNGKGNDTQGEKGVKK
jgi:nitrogen fixation NifU-like protein